MTGAARERSGAPHCRATRAGAASYQQRWRVRWSPIRLPRPTGMGEGGIVEQRPAQVERKRHDVLPARQDRERLKQTSHHRVGVVNGLDALGPARNERVRKAPADGHQHEPQDVLCARAHTHTRRARHRAPSSEFQHRVGQRPRNTATARGRTVKHVCVASFPRGRCHGHRKKSTASLPALTWPRRSPSRC